MRRERRRRKTHGKSGKAAKEKHTGKSELSLVFCQQATTILDPLLLSLALSYEYSRTAVVESRVISTTSVCTLCTQIRMECGAAWDYMYNIRPQES